MSIWEKQIGGKHYKKMKIQPSEFVHKNNMLFAEGNVIKYICRHPFKDGKQDLLKAIHYCEMIIERDYPEKKEKKGKTKIDLKGRLQEIKEKKESWIEGYKKWKAQKNV